MTESVLRFRVETKDANAKINRLKQQVQKLEVAVKGAGGSTKVAGAGFKAFSGGAQAAAVGARGLGAALSTALGPLTAVVAAAASLGQVFNVLRQQDFAEAKVRSLGVNSEELTARLKNVSTELSGQASVLDLTGAAYDVASAGFNNAADAALILKAASQGATGGFSDINTVGDATTSVLNAYGLEADKASKLVDGFIQTQNDGKIVIGEYAANIAKVAPVAAALGVPLEEVNAAVAQITAGGQGAEVTFTALKTAFAQVAAGKVGNEFKALGIEINASTLKSDGLAGTLEKIKKSGADAGTVIKAFGTEAGPSILALLNDTEKYNQLLENQKNSQGAAAKAAFTASDTIDGQLKRLTTAFQNLFSDQSELGVLIKETFKVAAVTVEVLVAAINLLAAPTRAVGAAMKEIGGAIAEALGIEATDAAFKLEQGFQNIMKGVTKAIAVFIGFGKAVGKIIGGLLAVNINFIKEVIGAYQRFGERVAGFFVKAADAGKQKFTELKDSVIGTVTNFVDAGKQKFAEFKDFVTTALSSPAQKASSVFGKLADFMQKIFKRLSEFANKFFTGFSDSAGATAENVTKFFGGLFEGLIKIINGFIEGLPPWLKSALGGVADFAGDIAGAIGNAMRGIKDVVTSVPAEITAAFGADTTGSKEGSKPAGTSTQDSGGAAANAIAETGGKLSKKQKEEADRLEKIAEQHENTVIKLQDKLMLASAVDAQELKMFQRQIALMEILRNKKGLSDEQLLVELNLTKEIFKQQEATEGRTKAEKDLAEAQENADKAQQKAADALKEKYKKVGDAIKSNVTDSIVAAIEGTKSLGESAMDILKNLANQFLRLGINQLFSLAGSMGPAGGILSRLFGGGRASGGTVKSGTSYMVGERGPELFTPGRSGSIAPNRSLGGGANVTVNVDASGSSVKGDGDQAGQLGKAIGIAVQQELIKQKRPGGLLAR